MNYRLRRILFTALLMLADLCILSASFYLAVLLRFDFRVPSIYNVLYLHSLPLVLGIFYIFCIAFGLYKYLWKYASIEMVFKVLLATTFAGVVSFLCNNSLNTNHYNYLASRGIYAIFTVLSTLVLGGLRIVLKLVALLSQNPFISKKDAKRAMVIGGGWAGASTVRDLKAGRAGNVYPVLIVDDDESRIGSRINGVKILGGTDKIKKYAEDYKIDEIFIAIATPKGKIEDLIVDCLDTGCDVRRVANIQEIDDVNTSHSVFKNVDLLDLLGRPEEKLDKTKVSKYFCNRTVLITGGGGSIGSELSRQIMGFGVKQLILFDMSENYIYDLRNELILKFGDLVHQKLVLCVGSVQDRHRLETVFKQYCPDIVLHAAAHKHVPLMEDCPTQAVLNNVVGSYNVANVARTYGAKSFVLISTDKAVNPTNVMGATKRLSELIIEGMNTNGNTKFMIVRFGNVLGSHGSVVPLFEQQIRAGGPVTVTDPNVIRYFMSIQEAASLVLQAASIAQGGELFVLDMGKPVKIIDLAKRMIKLYSDPNKKPVEIKIVGMRSGEKILEELLNSGEDIIRTDIEKIKITKSDIVSEEEISQILQKIQYTIENQLDMRATLKTLVPTFKDPEEVNSHMRNIHVQNREYTN